MFINLTEGIFFLEDLQTKENQFQYIGEQIEQKSGIWRNL